MKIFYIIKMDENKYLSSGKENATIYQNENNADHIKVLIPKQYGILDLLHSSITMHYLTNISTANESQSDENDQEKLYGNILLLEFIESVSNEGFLECYIPISINFTKNTGKIELWLEVSNKDGIILKTNTVKIQINEHKDITDVIPDEQIRLLDDYIIKMEQLINKCEITLELATEQANRSVEAANITIELLKQWEEEHGNKI